MRLRADELARRRAEAGVQTDSALAERAGVTQPTVGRVIAGKTDPSNAFIAGLVRAFNCRIDDLFEVVPAEQ